MALSRPLAIAAVAMVLLVGSVSFEVAFQRVYTVQVHDAIGWQTVGQSATDITKPIARAPNHAVLAAANASVEFRVQLDNGYPWAASERYDVIVNGLSVADGTVSAPARGFGESTFTVPASTLFTSSGAPIPTKDGPAGSNITFVNLYVEVGSHQVYASFQLQEASP